MANALQFIESNYEDLSEAEQIEKMRESLKEVCVKKAVGPAVSDTLEKTTQNADLVVLKLIKETVENSDEKFKKWLQDNIEMFSGMIEMELMDK